MKSCSGLKVGKTVVHKAHGQRMWGACVQVYRAAISDGQAIGGNYASSKKTVGKLRFGQLPKCMIKSNLPRVSSSKAIAPSYRQFHLGV